MLTDQGLPVNIKADFFRTTGLPALLYACETWSTTKRDEEKFALAGRTMGSRMWDITRIDRLNSEELRRRTGVKDVGSEIYAANGGGWSVLHEDLPTAGPIG